MNEIWFEEDLFPEPDWKKIIEGSKSKEEMRGSADVKGKVRLHTPRHKIVGTSEHIAFSRSGFVYAFVRLGFELDPGEEARSRKYGFASAKFTIHLWGEGNLQPSIYDLYPYEINHGKPSSVKLKLEPSITLVSGAGASLGGLETDMVVGQVAPTVRGFKGDEERIPYWNLQSHRESPLYGLRHFWVLIEAPQKLKRCYLIPFVETTMQSAWGLIPLGPDIDQVEHRPRYVVDFA